MWTGPYSRPFEWAVTRARLDVLANRWDLEGRADRLRAWASALEALAHAHRALRDHPDIPEEDGVVEQLENQALLLRTIAAADRTWFLRSQAETIQDELPERSPSSPDIEAAVGKHLDLLSSITTSQNERIVVLAEMKVLLAPTLGAAAVQLLHDVS